MMDWLTVLKLLAGALAVLLVLHLISLGVNRSREKAAAKAKGAVKARSEAKARGEAEAEAEFQAGFQTEFQAKAEEKAPSTAADKAEVVTPAVATRAEAASVASEPMHRASAPAAAAHTARKSDAPVRTLLKKSPLASGARPKRPMRPKPATATKVVRRPKRQTNGTQTRVSAFRALSKAKPAILRRPKRIAKVRRRKSKDRAPIVPSRRTNVEPRLRPH